MLTSAAWINDYLDPAASAEEQAELLTRAGFPIEASETVALADGVDHRQDVELTSNRGDVGCHLGMAREIASMSERTLRPPRPARLATSGAAASSAVSVTNEDHDACPLYTARIIRGVTIGPSPAWLRDRLIARGDVPRNNVVDATNFVLFELGQPTHVFDLATLRGGRIVVRRARKDEPFLPLGEGAAEIALHPEDLVIADAERPVALAGVKGGAVTAVGPATTDLLLEAATFAPVAVRAASRRHGIASDSSWRFERGVHPAQIEEAAERLAGLILELAGGTLAPGVVSDGSAIPAPREVTLRPDRCRALLGVELPDDRMASLLEALGFAPKREGDRFRCTVPPRRLDVEREIDLVEEVGRMYGFDAIPLDETISVRVAPPQPREEARRAVADALVGLGFVESITHSLVEERAAEAFMPRGMTALTVDDERARATPVLRPSILPSLLRVAAHNVDQGTRDVRLFEHASVYGRVKGDHAERVNLAFLHPAADADPLRETRGIVERLVGLLRGPAAAIEVEPLDAFDWLAPGATVRFGGEVLGTYGLLSPAALAVRDLKGRWCAAEIGLPALYDVFPPETEAHALPAFPAIERDLSVLVAERVAWADLHRAIDALALEALEAIEFVGIFRGGNVPAGRKSVTLRMRFRAADRTLVHDEIDPRVAAALAALERDCAAQLRG